MAAGADVFQHRVPVIPDVDPVDVDARRHDVADGAVADAEHATDQLKLLMTQKPRLLAGGHQRGLSGGTVGIARYEPAPGGTDQELSVEEF